MCFFDNKSGNMKKEQLSGYDDRGKPDRGVWAREKNVSGYDDRR